VTSFFGIKGAFFSKTKTDLRQFFLQGLVENTCSLQPALKSNAAAFKVNHGMSIVLCTVYIYFDSTNMKNRMSSEFDFYFFLQCPVA